jgi:hypothetical protein
MLPSAIIIVKIKQLLGTIFGLVVAKSLHNDVDKGLESDGLAIAIELRIKKNFSKSWTMAYTTGFLESRPRSSNTFLIS